MEHSGKHLEYIKTCEQAVETAAEQYLRDGSGVSQAARYSLLGGGKHIRGVLVLAVCDMLGGDMEAAGQLASAVEMMHTFSLIHDDLPCLDNDDLRRGKPSCHIAFGEGVALLAGDLLAITALQAAAGVTLSGELAVKAVRLLGSASGANGMIYGQELDIKHEKTTASEEELYEIHRYKTAALIKVAAVFGVLCSGDGAQDRMVVEGFADKIGLVFQIVDDILDVVAKPEILGKPVGSDQKSDKTTFVSLFGMERAKQAAKGLTQIATQELESAYGKSDLFLSYFAKELAERVK